MESPGRPTVFSDRLEMERILYDLMKNPTVRVGRPAKMWHYLTDMEADTDMTLMQSVQPVMDAFARFRADLRISQRALAKAYVTVMRKTGRYRGKDVEHFANAQALMLRVACSHWLRDCKLKADWTVSFGIPHPPLSTKSDTQERL